MRAYKLAGAGTIATLGNGVSPVAILKSGRIKGVQYAIVGYTAAANLNGGVQVGTAAVSESGVESLPDPTNFASIQVGHQTTGAYVFDNGFLPCDKPISQGERLMLNFNGANDFQVEQCEIIVWVQE